MKRVLPIAALLAVLAGTAFAASTKPPTPTFEARRDYPGLFTEFIAVADVNGDGIPDIVADGGANFDVLLGNGNGTFRSGPETTTIMSNGTGFVVAGLTGSGSADLVVAGHSSAYGNPAGVAVCLGNGNGTFQKGTFYQAGSDQFIRQAVVGDFNNDGILDIVTVGESGIWLFTGKGGGVFNPGVLIPFTGSGSDFSLVVAAYFNNDSNLDLAITTLTGFVVLLGNGNGTFQPAQAYTTPSVPGIPGGLIAADINADGNMDIALDGGKDGQILQYFGNGAGGFSKPKLIDNVPGGSFTFADVNGDGIPDLVTAYVYVALGKGDGTFGAPTFYAVAGAEGIYSVAVADLRNDGRNDIVSGGLAAISVLLNKGNGRYQDGETVSITGGATCGVASDFDGDGSIDLALNAPSGISLLLGTGNASPPFTTGASIALSGAGCLVTGDLNNDGIPDLLVPTSDNTVVAYLGNGSGTFTQASTTSVTTWTSLGAVALGDFNHDGNLDFANAENMMALGNGDGTFQTPTLIWPDPPYLGFNDIAVGDLNGDGWDDIILTNSDIGYIYVLINDQQGGFNVTTIEPNPEGGFDQSAQVVLADLKGSGSLDAVVGQAGLDGGVAIYLNNGAGTFTLQQTLTDAAEIPGPVWVADVNGDGIPDICLSEAGTIAVFLGLGGGTFTSTPFYIGAGPSPGDILNMKLHGQSPTAGVPDIVVPALSAGVTVLLNETKPK